MQKRNLIPHFEARKTNTVAGICQCRSNDAIDGRFRSIGTNTRLVALPTEAGECSVMYPLQTARRTRFVLLERLSAEPFAIDMPCALVTDIDGLLTLTTTPMTVDPNMWRMSIGEETRTAVAVVIRTVLFPSRLARYFR